VVTKLEQQRQIILETADREDITQILFEDVFKSWV